eukprot:COSAG02_NODE_27962_length_599_cov_0.968000_1_plen_38_part_10
MDVLCGILGPYDTTVIANEAAAVNKRFWSSRGAGGSGS